MDNPSPTLPTETAPKKSSGKKWVLFGCGGCLGLMVLGGIAIAGFVVMVMGALKGSDVYKTALGTAQASPEVQASLGTPITDSWYAGGSVNYNNGAGEADLTFPVEGPNGKGVMHVTASKPTGGSWEYSVMTFTAESGETIDLLPAVP